MIVDGPKVALLLLLLLLLLLPPPPPEPPTPPPLLWRVALSLVRLTINRTTLPVMLLPSSMKSVRCLLCGIAASRRLPPTSEMPFFARDKVDKLVLCSRAAAMQTVPSSAMEFPLQSSS